MRGPLRGRDAASAEMGPATIAVREQKNELSLEQARGFRCEIDFDAKGSPSVLRRCRAGRPGVRIPATSIALRCRELPAEHVEECSGDYLLIEGDAQPRQVAITVTRAL